jgi:hypothetical protein
VLAGLATTQAVEHSLARQRAEWRPVPAQLTERAPGTTSSGAERVWAEVRWTATDGSAHTGQTRVEAGSTAGTPVTVWTDRDGRLASKPATESQAALRAALIGTLVGVSAATVPFAGGRAVRGRMERRRMEQWDAEWKQVGPQWGWKTG